MMYINGINWIAKDLHYKSSLDDNTGFYRKKGLKIVPRVLADDCVNWDRANWHLDNFKLYTIIPEFTGLMAYGDDTCITCDYSENCNGQMCFFSML